jgi:hypothetical protein
MALDPAVRARVLAKLLALGFQSRRDAIAWVDALVAETDSPQRHLIDASLSATDGQLISALEAFAAATGAPHAAAVRAAVLAELASWLSAHPDDGPRIARALYRMAVAGEFPDPNAERRMYALDDQYELASEAVYGVREEVDRELREFLAGYESPTRAR